jgi:hypothetical protein
VTDSEIAYRVGGETGQSPRLELMQLVSSSRLGEVEFEGLESRPLGGSGMEPLARMA